MRSVDRAALDWMSVMSIARSELQRFGFRATVASTDLHPYGYMIRHWLRLRDMHEVLEYNPRLSDLPRLTVDNYPDQCRLHRALGLNVVQRGEQWHDSPLFAAAPAEV